MGEARIGSARVLAWLPLVLLVGWCAVAWVWLRAPAAALDWMGWRQSDTQTIALNLLRPGASLFYPQIAWGGDGPGYVESELSLYPALVASIMRLVGPCEWPGQALSLCAMAGVFVQLWFHLASRHRALAVFGGLVAFLGARAVSGLSLSIQPDALALLADTVAWAALCRYARTGALRPLLEFGLAGTIAMLIKPTAAQIGVSGAVLLLLTRRDAFRRPAPWLCAAGMLGTLALHLHHAHDLFVAYGNTFGVLWGGDSKLPHARQLFEPRVLLSALREAVSWGTGLVGAACLVVLALRRRWDPEILALLAGNVALTVLALRYTSGSAGEHYHVFSSITGACAAARVIDELEPQRSLRWAAPALVALASVQLIRTQVRRRHERVDPGAASIVEAAGTLRRVAAPDDLVVVRSLQDSYDTSWQRPNNYQDPRVFYLARRRGFALARDQEDPRMLQEFVRRGARYFADPAPATAGPLAAWLAHEARLLGSTPGGARVWRLPFAERSGARERLLIQ